MTALVTILTLLAGLNSSVHNAKAARIEPTQAGGITLTIPRDALPAGSTVTLTITVPEAKHE